jgi:phage-related protein
LLGFKVDDSGRQEYNKGIDQTKQKQQSLTASFLKANLIMSTVNRGIGAALGFIRHEVIGVTAETERFRVVIRNMIGDQEKANKVIHELDYSPVSDFYGTTAAIGGLRSFATMGMDIEKARDQMTLLGDVAQGNGEAFASLSSTMAQVYSRGKADAMRLKQFMSQGFDVAGVLGLTEAQQKAGVTYKQVEEALRRVTAAGGPYNNMLQKQMNTLGGLIKQFKSLKAATAEAIGLGINDELKGLLKYILEIGRAGQENFVGVFVKAIKEVIHWIWQIIIMWKVLGYRLSDMGDALAPVKQFFLDLKDAAGDALTGIMKLAVEAGRFIVAAFKPIQAFASPIIKELGAIAKDVFTAIADFIRPLVPMVEGSAGFFGVLGQAIAGLLRPALKMALALKGIGLAFGTFKAVKGTIETVSGTFGALKGTIDAVKTASKGVGHGVSGIGAALSKLTGSPELAAKLADAFGLLTGKVSVFQKAAEGNRLALMMLDARMLKSKITTLAHTAATKAAAIATKAWKGIQAAFNAVMAGNPIALIIIGVMALIAAIILLVKNWDKVVEWVKTRFPNIYAAITTLVENVKTAFKKIVQFFLSIIEIVKPVVKAWTNIIKAGVGAWINIFKAVINAIKGIWSGLLGIFKAIFGGIINIFKNTFGTILTTVLGIVDGIIGIWSGSGNIFQKIFESIKLIITKVWEGITNIILGNFKIVFSILESFGVFFQKVFEGCAGILSAFIEGIKDIGSAIIGFFSSLWEAVMQSPAEAIEYIKTAFFGLFNSLQEKLFGFINKVREGWETVKGFFGGIGDGVVNFFTGDSGGGGGQMQPAYAGSTPQAAMAGAVGQTSNYAYTTTGGSSTVNAQTSINVNVPPGTPQEQREAIARQVDAQFNARLADSINSSRANIPSPEVRRH